MEKKDRGQRIGKPDRKDDRKNRTPGYRLKDKEPETNAMEFINIVDRFSKKRICVIGDIIADVFIYGKPYRLSREAPVVVIRHENEIVCPGSAGNTINNLLALGAHVYPLGFIGNDSPGERLMGYFARFKNIALDGIIRYDGETVTKTRILAGDTHTSKQQVIRIDKDTGDRPTSVARQLLMKRLKEIAHAVDAFILSDYGHGTIDEEIVDFLRHEAEKKIVVGDSRYNLRAFKGITIITPNESEAYALCSAGEDDDIEVVGRRIMGFMDISALLITRGNRGMSLFLKDGSIHHIPISGTDDVTDVTGAGDTVCATLTLSLASGASYLTSSMIANYAAGVVVMKRGTATVSPEELKKEIEIGMERDGQDSKGYQ
ncbi:MAG: bifunctional hydroxymethylpyrimidine kinase/phosphomethylpyrimidine kinase [Syntrophorhabdaceae bacterium]|nr:bifunctional hydroxymethylpyrimidine kinase/phosphomethylpyrimidine kinase [Syntrophorhabdaceae bacterium]